MFVETLKKTLASTLSATLLMSVLLATQGCFIFIDDYDDDDEVVVVDNSPPPVVNHLPEILPAESFWTCDYDDYADEYFFEFQVVVEDWDGPSDVDFVDVSVFQADRDVLLDTFSLLYEGDAVWGGIIWELDSNLYCGDPIDVLFEAWDSFDAYDSLFLTYY